MQFLDVAQAFDKVYHTGLINKVRPLLPGCFHKLFNEAQFQGKYKNILSEQRSEQVGREGVYLYYNYLTYTANFPVNELTTTAPFADDTNSHAGPKLASLQQLKWHLGKI